MPDTFIESSLCPSAYQVHPAAGLVNRIVAMLCNYFYYLCRNILTFNHLCGIISTSLNRVKFSTNVNDIIHEFRTFVKNYLQGVVTFMPIKLYKRQVNKKKDDSKYAHWSERQRIQAVTTYLMVGKWPLVSEATGIPVNTLRHWKMQDWWKEMEEEVRRSSNIELGGKFQKIRDKAAEIVMDRLEEGDLYMDKDGKLRRRPINARTATDIMTKAVDRELLIQKLEEKPKVQEEAIMDRLKTISDLLLKAAGGGKTPSIIDVEVIDGSDSLPSDSDGSGPVELEAGSSDGTTPGGDPSGDSPADQSAAPDNDPSGSN